MSDDVPRKTLKSYVEALTILAKYNKDTWALDAEHDIIYAHVNEHEVSPEDAEALLSLGWHVSSDTDGWAVYT